MHEQASVCNRSRCLGVAFGTVAKIRRLRRLGNTRTGMAGPTKWGAASNFSHSSFRWARYRSAAGSRWVGHKAAEANPRHRAADGFFFLLVGCALFPSRLSEIDFWIVRRPIVHKY
jgi:hypothetical protein